MIQLRSAVDKWQKYLTINFILLMINDNMFLFMILFKTNYFINQVRPVALLTKVLTKFKAAYPWSIGTKCPALLTVFNSKQPAYL